MIILKETLRDHAIHLSSHQTMTKGWKCRQFSLSSLSLFIYFAVCRVLCLYRMYESIYKKSSKSIFLRSSKKSRRVSQQKWSAVCIIFDSQYFFLFVLNNKKRHRMREGEDKIEVFCFPQRNNANKALDSLLNPRFSRFIYQSCAC